MNPSFDWRHAPPGDYAVIGSPVEHSLSPKMHRAAFLAFGLRKSYNAIEVPPGATAEALDSLKRAGYKGVNVTVPLKEEAARICRSLDPVALQSGSVNTVVLESMRGYNTDGPGLVECLKPYSEGEKVLLLGAGGSAKAIAVSLEGAGFELLLWNRTKSHAERLVEVCRIGAKVVEAPDPTGARIIINATSSTLLGDNIDVQWSSAAKGGLAIDLMYGRPSPFLQSAAEAGLKTMDGLRLLVEQGALAFSIWLNLPAPKELMLKAIT